jgi:hypothetical protein
VRAVREVRKPPAPRLNGNHTKEQHGVDDGGWVRGGGGVWVAGAGGHGRQLPELAVSAPRWLDADETLALRTARKHRVCCQGGGDGSHASPACTITIRPGEAYVEYMGETPAYHTGHAYCLPCHLKHWGDIAPLPAAP